jgi:hypothetical protein
MKQGQIKTIQNSAKKHLAESETYEAVYLTKNEETEFYLFTEVELRKGLQRSRMQPEEENSNSLSTDLTGAYYGVCLVIGIILGAMFF